MPKIKRRDFLRASVVAGGAATLLPWQNFFSAETSAALSSFQQRRDWVLDAVVAEPLKQKELYWAAQACFVRGKTELGLKAWQEAVKREMVARVRGVELFNYWPAIHCIAKWGHLLDPESKSAIKKILATFTEYKDMRTSNLHTLACVTRYLAGQAFGETDFVEASHFRPNDHNAAKALRQLIEKCAREGFGEWASWPYFVKNILPILSIAELAADAQLRNRAFIAFESGLAQNAPFWLHGRWAMTTGRSYPDILSQKPWGGPQLLWLYFGGTTPDLGGNLIGAAVMDYKPPRLIELAASDRAKPFTARSHFGKNYQTSFLDRDYGIFSEAQTQVTDWWQSYPFGVMWNEPDTAKHSFLWLTAPMNDSKADISGSHPHGVYAKAQSNLQHESAVLYVFQFTENTKYPYALGFVPGGALAFVNDALDEGKIYLHYRGVLIALSSTNKFNWNRTAGIRAPSGTPNTDDSEFRVEGPSLVMAIECAHPDEFPGASPTEKLAKFRDAIRVKTKIEITGAAGRYSSRKGNIIERVFQGEAKINGQPVDFSQWPMIDSPWVKQPRCGPLTLTDGREKRVYDFEKWTVAVS